MAEISQDGGGKKGGKKRSKKASTKIDMTPMVDLGFLLITFFMLTTTLAKPVVMQLSMPDKTENDDKSEVKMSETLTVIPDSATVYYYQGLPTDITVKVLKTDYSNNGIRTILFDMKKKIGKNFTIVIKAAKTAKYKNMVDLLDECEITGNGRYAILDIDPGSEALVKKSGL